MNKAVPIIAVAPMLDWTDRHCRYFLRLFSSRIRLYTEMITTDALLHGDREKLLAFHPLEQPVALQLGGSQPKALAICAQLAEQAGYNEVNLNVGCPSSRVQAGRFGACLMAEPELVAECVAAMRAAVRVPVTVKTRLGIDQHDEYEFLHHFVEQVSLAGCQTFIIHARKAWLQGLNPKENREIPPLNYERVIQVKNNFPHLQIILNGGITSLAEIKEHLAHFEGVMLGRVAYQNPYLLAFIDQTFYDSHAHLVSRFTIVQRLLPYLEEQVAQGVPLSAMARHLLGLFHGQPGAKHWRRSLTYPAIAGQGVDWIRTVLHEIQSRSSYAVVS